MHDRRILYASAFLRATGTGLIGVLLGVYLARLPLRPAAIGGVVASGLAGGALAALFATLFADLHGRRRVLVELASLGAIGACIAAVVTTPVGLGIAAFVGMLNGMGRDRGGALIVEQAILPATAGVVDRTKTFAYYNLFQDAGHALGSLLAGVPSFLEGVTSGPHNSVHRLAIGSYAAIMVLSIQLYRRLSPTVEAPRSGGSLVLSPASRRILTRISALFALDSLAGGLLTTALLSYFFLERFGAREGAVSLLFFGARVMNALSHLGAAWLARRIGLVNTMVFTHIPSSLLLGSVALVPSFPVAAFLFLIREGLVEMDVPTRQSYVLAIVRPEERTVASGVTNLVRLASWAVGPALAGLSMQGIALMTPLLVGAAMKIGYDILLYIAFRAVKPPEEAG